MLFAFLQGMILVGAGCWCALRCRLPHSYATLMILGLACIGGFFAGLAGIFHIYLCVIDVAGLAAAAAWGWRVRKLRSMSEENRGIVRDMLFFLLLFSVCVIFVSMLHLFYWDEYFWGEFSKVLFLTHGFWDAETPILGNCINTDGYRMLHSMYMPGMAILQNLFQNPFGYFSDRAMGVANLFLMLVSVSACSEAICRRYQLDGRRRRCVVLLLLVPSLVYVRNMVLSPDFYMSFLFTTGVMIAFFDRKGKYADRIQSVLSALLTLLKSVNLALALFLAVVQTLPLVVAGKWRASLKKFCRIFVPSVMLFAGWGIYLRITGIRPELSDDRLLPALLDLRESWGTVWGNLWSALTAPVACLWTSDSTVIPGVLCWFAIFVVSATLWAIWNRRREDKLLWLDCGLFAMAFVAWFLLHCYVWFNIYDIRDGRIFCSLQRYMMPFTLTLQIIIFALLIPRLLRHVRGIVPVMLIGVGAPFLFMRCFLSPPPGPELKDTAEFLRANTVPGSRIWLVAQGSAGFETMALRYRLFGERIIGLPHFYWSLGEKRDCDPRWHKEMNSEQWHELIRKYKTDYIYLYHVDDSFLERLGQIFTLIPATGHLNGVLFDCRRWRDGRSDSPVYVASNQKFPPLSGKNGNITDFLDGMWIKESRGAWLNGDGMLVFSTPKLQEFVLELRLWTLQLPDRENRQIVDVWVNGIKTVPLTVCEPLKSYYIPISGNSENWVIRMSPRNMVRPKSSGAAGWTYDEPLAFYLEGLGIVAK